MSAFNSSEHRYFPRRLSETMAWNIQSHHIGPRNENKGNTELSTTVRSLENTTYLHSGAYRKWQLTEWCFQDVDQRHGDKDLLGIQDVPVIQHHVDSKHSKGNLQEGEKIVNSASRDLSDGWALEE